MWKNPSDQTVQANTIIQTSLWMFFLLVNAYYGGALTMFFVSELTLPFNTLRDVLQIFPEWKLVFIVGYEASFKLPADQVFSFKNGIESFLIHLHM